MGGLPGSLCVRASHAGTISLVSSQDSTPTSAIPSTHSSANYTHTSNATTARTSPSLHVTGDAAARRSLIIGIPRIIASPARRRRYPPLPPLLNNAQIKEEQLLRPAARALALVLHRPPRREPPFDRHRTSARGHRALE